MMSETSLEPGWLEADGYWSLTALGMSLDPWLLGGRAVSTVEVLEETGKKARLLLRLEDDEEQAAVLSAELTDRGWVASVIQQCQ